MRDLLKRIAQYFHNRGLSLKGRMPLASGAMDGGFGESEADKPCYESVERFAGETASQSERVQPGIVADVEKIDVMDHVLAEITRMSEDMGTPKLSWGQFSAQLDDLINLAESKPNHEGLLVRLRTLREIARLHGRYTR